MPELDHFLDLTPERVLAAVEAAGLPCRTLCYPLPSFENRVYEVELENRNRVVAKFYRPGRWTAEQIQEEHRFLLELEDEEIPVCSVRPFPDGQTLAEIDGINYSISERRGGRSPDELDDILSSRLGHLVARIHNVGARRDAGARPPLGSARYVRGPLALLVDRGLLPRAYERRFVEAAETIAGRYDVLTVGVPVQRIHADLHFGNLLLRDDLLHVLDFDDFALGPQVQDFWLLLPGRSGASDRLRATFLDSYEQLREFDRSTLALIEPLRGLRMVRYIGWLAKRWHDPAFKAGWPHFGSRDYWREETEDLEAQLRVIEREPRHRPGESGSGGRGGELESVIELETELTNKDYFWDWEGD